ncbi:MULTISPECIES: heparan-alpha-glucosaminide N-acetyltransferase [unclassified Rhizobium]|uniref:heparan-alpha-glucosaminide N-acetyltransferase n=1 Tax=unclassified Rhizobium TaxID=2613769 RepID=UPI0017822298|nr:MULTISPECIES: DUF1624 domain-containing protein [unclassified Rhizobium]MBD8689301.1 DUF1624 domain-containing protein [Rhizobium sp. CFBP 13644]MBD8693153.1 DUF1624 domain-containing protein [Rhizobium sp. CFBP 13717]
MSEVPATADITRSKGRIGALDTLRGIALIAMASYHFTWDLEMFGYLDPGTATQGWWRLYARGIASTFLFLAGFSLYLAHRRGVHWPSYGKRFAMVAGAALLISVATYFAVPDGWIFFGILHNIATASLIGLLFLRLPFFVTLVFAALALIAPRYLSSDAFNPIWLSWIGLSTAPPRSNDYVPLLPFLAPFLLGLAISQFVTPRGWLDRFRKPSGRKNILALFGRHSLLFYLVHQPVLIAIVYLASLVAPVDQVENYKTSCEMSCLKQQDNAELCQRFCGCTLEKLQAESLFEPMMANKLAEAQQSQIGEIAAQCSREM